MISESVFVDEWGAKAQESGDLFTYEQVKNQDCRKVWTVVDTGGEDDNWIALAGFHVVNALGYVLTTKPWETGLEQAMWFEADDEDEPDEFWE